MELGVCVILSFANKKHSFIVYGRILRIAYNTTYWSNQSLVNLTFEKKELQLRRQPYQTGPWSSFVIDDCLLREGSARCGYCQPWGDGPALYKEAGKQDLRSGKARKQHPPWPLLQRLPPGSCLEFLPFLGDGLLARKCKMRWTFSEVWWWCLLEQQKAL